MPEQPLEISVAPAWKRMLHALRPSHRHSAFTASLLLMLSALLSRVIGLVRVKYTAYLFGRGAAADALNAAFQLPDMISYFLVGGAASITFVTILSRYRDQGKEPEGERAMSAILTVMALVLGGAILLAEVLAPTFVRVAFRGFDAEKAALCVRLTRILLPAQLFFFAGGVFGSVLLVRKQFAFQAVTPLIYNLGTILGGVVLARAVGISSLAIGTVAGAFAGPFLLNAAGAYRAGMQFRPVLDLANPGFREWLRMSLPLMAGMTLVTFDSWIMNHFASHDPGAITALNYAKTLFNAPVALGQAAGAASLPFLASLFTQRNVAAYSNSVNAAVSRILAFSLLLSGWMIGLAFPVVDLIFRGGSFHRADAGAMALYFSIFSVSLCSWSAQQIYSRAFYAAGDTLTPMVTGTVVLFASLPIYWGLYRAFGVVGLTVASDLGITIQTVTLAVLLHRQRMVSLADLEYGELGRALLAGVFGFVGVFLVGRLMSTGGRWQDLSLIVVATLVWLLLAGLVLRVTKSALPGQLAARFSKRRKPLGKPPLISEG